VSMAEHGFCNFFFLTRRQCEQDGWTIRRKNLIRKNPRAVEDVKLVLIRWNTDHK
jgi:hypothetical protein